MQWFKAFEFTKTKIQANQSTRKVMVTGFSFCFLSEAYGAVYLEIKMKAEITVKYSQN